MGLWGCGAVTGVGPRWVGLTGRRGWAKVGRDDGDGPRWVGMTGTGRGGSGRRGWAEVGRDDGGWAEVGRADGGRHGYPPLSYDVTDAVVC